MNVRNLSNDAIKAALSPVQSGRLVALIDLALTSEGFPRGQILDETSRMLRNGARWEAGARFAVMRMARAVGVRGAEVLLAILMAEVGGRLCEPAYKFVF